MDIVVNIPGFDNSQYATHTITYTIKGQQAGSGVVITKDKLSVTSTY